MSNIIRLRLEEKIRFLLLRYSGNIDRVAKEASEYANTEVPVEVVIKIMNKFKKKQDKDVRYWMACNMAQEMLQRSLERQAKLEAMFQRWEGQEEVQTSHCCNYPVQVLEDNCGNTYYRCLKCNETCNPIKRSKLELENLKLRIIKDMRQESKFLLESAKKLGFTNPEEKEPTPVNKNFIIVNNQQSENSRKPVIIDSQIAQEAADMEPRDREKLIHQLKDMVEESENSEKKEIDNEGIK